MSNQYRSQSHRRRVTAVSPYSLLFTQSDAVVNCGDDPSIMDLHAGNFTVDFYWQCPALATYSNYTLRDWIGQGVSGSPGSGWYVYLAPMNLPNAWMRFVIVDGSDALVMKGQPVTLVEGQWYYVRVRRSGNTMYISVDAGGEASGALAAGGKSSSANLHLNDVGGGWSGPAFGRWVYCHIWNNNQGALDNVPTKPHALDENTVAQYRFVERVGAVLGDDSDNENDGSISKATWSEIIPFGWKL